MINVIAVIKAKANQWEKVKQALKKLETLAIKEEGCIEYNFFQDTSLLERFYCIEMWESTEYLDKHAQGENVQACLKEIDAILAEPVQVSIMDKI